MVDSNINTNITATANFSSLTAQLQAVTSELIKLQTTTLGLNQKLNSQIGQMNRSFVDTMRSTGQFSSHFVTLSSDVDKFGKNLASGRMKLSEYYSTWQNHAKKTSTIVKDLAKQQVMLQNSVVQPLGRNAQGLMQYNVMVARGLDENANKMQLLRQEQAIMNRVMQDGSNQLINWGKNTQWAGRQLTVGLTVPLAAFGAAASRAFLTADSELVRLTKVYGGLTQTSAEDLAKIRKDIAATAKELAVQYGASYKDSIALAADLAATGLQGNALVSATKETTRLAVLGEVDRQDAMKATLAIQNAFKQSTEELTQSIDFLNAVENQTSTSLGDLVEAIPKAGPVVKSLGGDVKDLALYLTAMKEGGVNASEGANAIKSALASLINPTKVAKEMFSGFGIDLAGIVSSNAGDLTGTIMSLQKALDSLDPLSKSKAIEQLFGKFQFARMSALFENLGKQGSQTLQVLDLMKASTQDLANISAREMKQMTESASGQYKRALESVKADMAAAGESFLKISTFVLKAIDGIVKFITDLPGPIKSILTFVGGLTALAGPLIMLTGVLGNFFGYIVKGIFNLKQFFKGGSAFKLLTPEIMAAEAAAKAVGDSFYSDAKAAKVFEDAVLGLARSFEILQTKAAMATRATHSSVSMSTVGGGAVTTGSGFDRVVNKDSQYLGKPYSRDMSHTIPSGEEQLGTIFGVVPGTGPVNRKISNNPQMYMDGDLPRIPGITSINSVSTGIVASEAARWHAMTAAIAMQSKEELALLRQEVAATGTVTTQLSSSYSAMLPPMVELTSLAAAEGAAIVAQLQQGKITVDQARAKIIALNYQVEAMMAETAQMTAATMGRTVNLTTVPLTSQPTVDPITGKSNMKEMFHKGATASLVDKIARSLGVRTSGGGYSTETTLPIVRKNDGGMIYDPSRHGSVVPGPANVNYDMIPAKLPEGSYILNQKASRNNPDLVSMAQNKYSGGGRVVDALLTPKETYFDPEFTAANKPLLDKANSGSRIELRNTGGMLGGIVTQGIRNYGNIAIDSTDPVTKFIQYYAGSDREDLRLAAVAADASTLRSLGLPTNDAIFEATKWFDDRWRETLSLNDGVFSQDIFNQITTDDLPKFEKRLRKQEKYKGKLHKKRLSMPVKNRTTGGTASLTRKDWQYVGPTSAYEKIASRNEVLEAMAASSSYEKEKVARLIATANRFGDGPNNGVQVAHFTPGSSPNTPVAGIDHLGRAALQPWEINQIQDSLSSYGIFSSDFSLDPAENISMLDRAAMEHGYADHKDMLKKIVSRDTAPATKNTMRTSRGLTTTMQAVLDKKPKEFRGWLANRAMRMSKFAAKKNSGGMVGGLVKSGKYGYGNLFLGMPRSFKKVQDQRKARLTMEEIDHSLRTSQFANMDPTDFGVLQKASSGHSFPVEGIAGVYKKPDGSLVFVKPVMHDTEALAEQRATTIVREAHEMGAPTQEIRTMFDPTDPNKKRKIIVLESKYDPIFDQANDGVFTQQDYFKQLVAANLRGDKDLSRDNLQGSIVNDVGTSGVFKLASSAQGKREYYGEMVDGSWVDGMPSMKEQARINLLGVKGGAKKFFAESTLDIPKGMTAPQYHQAMIDEIDSVLPKLRQVISSMNLTATERQIYGAMIKRLEDGRLVNWEEFHAIHSAVKPSLAKALTPAALLKLKTEAELRMRQRGHSVGLSSNSFKTDANGFNLGGMIEAREKGGPVNAGQPYLVGEKGPEIFFPKNDGGIVSNYALGGMVRSNKTGYGQDPTFLGMPSFPQPQRPQMGYRDSFKAGLSGVTGTGKPFNPNSGMGASMAGMGLMMGGQGLGGSTGSAMTNVGMAMQMYPLVKSIGPHLKGLTSMTGLITKLGVAGPAAFQKIGLAIRFMTGPIGLFMVAATAAYAIVKKIMNDNATSNRTYTLTYANTETGAKEAGVKYNNLSDSIKNVNEQLANTKLKGLAAYEALTKAGAVGISYSIKESKAAIKNAKENKKSLVKGFSDIETDTDSPAFPVGKNQIQEMATNLKIQMVLSGKSVQTATNEVYALVAASTNAKYALDAISSDGFIRVKDSATAATEQVARMTAALDPGLNSPDKMYGSDLGVALSNTALYLDANIKALVGTKDEFDNVIDEAKAYEIAMKQINDVQGSNVQLTDKAIESLKETHPELEEILNSTDNIASVLAKWRITFAGIDTDLKGISGSEAIALAGFVAVQQSALDAMEKTGKGVLGKSEKIITQLKKTVGKGLEAAQKAHNKNMRNAEDEIKAIDKRINKINEEAEARKRALQDAQEVADNNAEMQLLQIDYQAAISTGDMEAAANALIKITQLEKQIQTAAAMQAIEDRRVADVKKEEARKKSVQDEAEKAAKRLAALQEEASKNQIRLSKVQEYQLRYEQLIKDKMRLSAEGDPDKYKELEQAYIGNVKLLGTNLQADATGKDKSLSGMLLDIFGGSMIGKDGKSLATETTSMQYQGAQPTVTTTPGTAFSSIEAIAKQTGTSITKLGGGKTLFDLYNAILDGHRSAATAIKVSGAYFTETAKDGAIGVLTESARKKVVADNAITTGEFFHFNGWMYRVDADGNVIRGKKVPGSTPEPGNKSGLVTKASGGHIRGAGTATSDSIPAYLSNGEYVIKASSVAKYGTGTFDALNAGKYAEGGPVGKLGTADSMIKAAETMLGYREGKGNNTLFGRFAQKVYDLKTRYIAWCGAFINWAANKSGVDLASMIWTPGGAQSFKSSGKWTTMNPSRGDLAFMNFPGDGVNRISHVGLVKNVLSKNAVSTIEGNTSSSGSQRAGGGVFLKRRNYNQKGAPIVGFGRPSYKPVDAPADVDTDTDKYSTADQSNPNYKNSRYVAKRGDTLSDIAKKNGMTFRELMDMNPHLSDPKYKGGSRIFTGTRVNVKKFAAGGRVTDSVRADGYIRGAGTATSDSIPAMLSNGEYVIKADSVNKYGAETFDALNAGRFADGGLANAPNYAKQVSVNGAKWPVKPKGTPFKEIPLPNRKDYKTEKEYLEVLMRSDDRFYTPPDKEYGIDKIKSPMGTLSRFMDIAKSQIGKGHNYKFHTVTSPKGVSNTDVNKYTLWANDKYKLGSDALWWCGAFVQWVAENAGVEISDKMYSSYKATQYYKKNGLFNDLTVKKNLKNVKRGDLVWFDFTQRQEGTGEAPIPRDGVPDHASIVSKVFGKNISVIGWFGDYDEVGEQTIKTLPDLFGSVSPSFTKLAMGGPVKHYKPGGNVKGPGTSTSDSIPAMLSNGEYVIKADSVNKYGAETFDALNAGKFATGGLAMSKNIVAPRTFGKPNESPLALIIERLLSYLGNMPKDLVTSAITGGKYIAGATTGNPNWMDPKDEKMYEQALRNKENGQYFKGASSVIGRLGTSAIDVIPKLINWNKLWSKAGMKDLPGQTEYLLAQLPGEIITDLFKQIIPGNYAKGGLAGMGGIPRFHDGGPVGHKHSSGSKCTICGYSYATTNELNAWTDFAESQKYIADAGAEDPVAPGNVVDSMTKNEKGVAEYMHAWTSLLNTYYGAKYNDILKKYGDPGLLKKPILTDLNITNPRNIASLMGGLDEEGNLNAYKYGLSYRYGDNPIESNEILMAPPTSAGIGYKMWLPDTNAEIIRHSFPSKDPSKVDVKKYSDYINGKILSNDSYKMSLLAILFHEYGHSLQQRFKDVDKPISDGGLSKIFKDNLGNPLSSIDGKDNYKEVSADFLSGSIMSEMYNAGYMKTLSSQAVTRYLKNKYSSVAISPDKGISMEPGDPHGSSWAQRFGIYLKGFGTGNTDTALADYLGINPSKFAGDQDYAKGLVQSMSTSDGPKLNANNQLGMPDLLTKQYADILKLTPNKNVTPVPLPGKIAPKLDLRTPVDFANALIYQLGGKPTKALVNGIQRWIFQEGGHWNNKALYNPLNTTLEMPGSKKVNTVNKKTGTGVQAYTSWEQGLDAVIKTLGLSPKKNGYDKIVSALLNDKSKTPDELYKALNNSNWGFPKYDFSSAEDKEINAYDYNPSIPFDPDETAEWYSDWSKAKNRDKGYQYCTGSDCHDWEREDKRGKGGDEYEWDKLKPRQMPLSFNPETQDIDYVDFARPFNGIPKLKTNTLSEAIKSLNKKRAAKGVSIGSAATSYDIFNWDNRDWASAETSLPKYVYGFKSDSVFNVNKKKVAEGTVTNVIDSPDNEPWYFKRNGAINQIAEKRGELPNLVIDVENRYHRLIEKWFSMQNGPTGYKNGVASSLGKEFRAWLPTQGFNFNSPTGYANGGYVNPSYSANLSIPKFEDGINMVPADMLALLHKNEAVIPAVMNPFNPNANGYDIKSGSEYNINVTLNGSNLTPDDVAKAISREMQLRDSMAGRSRNK